MSYPIRAIDINDRNGPIPDLEDMELEEFIEWVKGSDFNYANYGRCGWFTLQSAAAYGKTDIVKYILSQPEGLATIDLGNEFGLTPLMSVALNIEHIDNTVEIAKILIDAGANTKLVSRAGFGHGPSTYKSKLSAHDFAIKKGNHELAELLNNFP